jgi:hypothetical protein
MSNPSEVKGREVKTFPSRKDYYSALAEKLQGISGYGAHKGLYDKKTGQWASLGQPQLEELYSQFARAGPEIKAARKAFYESHGRWKPTQGTRGSRKFFVNSPSEVSDALVAEWAKRVRPLRALQSMPPELARAILASVPSGGEWQADIRAASMTGTPLQFGANLMSPVYAESPEICRSVLGSECSPEQNVFTTLRGSGILEQLLEDGRANDFRRDLLSRQKPQLSNYANLMSALRAGIARDKLQSIRSASSAI